MKPVIKKETVYSVLLMRDDCGVRRFRMRAFWVKIACWLLVLVVLAASLGGYFAYNYRKKYTLLQDEYSAMERQLAETRRRLEPLLYLEKIQAINQNRFAANGVGNAAANATAVNGVNTVSPIAAGADNATSASTANKTEPTAPADAVTETVPAPIDELHPAKISNMSLRAASGTRIRISFDLSNQDPQLTLNGKVSLAVLTTTGANVEITQVDRGDLSFQIKSYKKVSTIFALPPDMTVADIAFVQVTLSGDTVPPYSENFAMQN